ncbi:hypothetical protein ACLOJK_009049 [Asimina triloba]
MKRYLVDEEATMLEKIGQASRFASLVHCNSDEFEVTIEMQTHVVKVGMKACTYNILSPPSPKRTKGHPQHKRIRGAEEAQSARVEAYIADYVAMKATIEGATLTTSKLIRFAQPKRFNPVTGSSILTTKHLLDGNEE